MNPAHTKLGKVVEGVDHEQRGKIKGGFGTGKGREWVKGILDARTLRQPEGSPIGAFKKVF